MNPEIFAGSILILLFSIILHEVMHGVAALYYGDKTAQKMGRLTLNPIPHIDPIGTILLPAIAILPPLLFGFPGLPFVFGWAKPVPVNPLNFRNIRQGELVVALAGVVSNFILAILGAILFHAFGTVFFPTLANLLSFVVHINLILAVFNLLPIPPLDGSKVLMSFLPPDLQIQYRKLESQGFLILLFLMMIPVGHSSLIGLIVGSIVNIFHALLQV